MTGLVRKATLLVSVCGLLAASAAIAAVPDPGNSGFDQTQLNLVGHDGVPPAAEGGYGTFAGDTWNTFVVHVEDLAGNNLQGSIVVIDFSLCSDVELCDDQYGNSTVDCPTKTVRKATDVNGDAAFNIIGDIKWDPDVDPDGQDCNCVQIFADGQDIVEPADEPVNVAGYDYNNNAGVNTIDLSLWLQLWGYGLDDPAGDIDHSAFVAGNGCPTSGPPNVTTIDLSNWLAGWGNSGSPYSCSEGGHTAGKCAP